MWAGVLIAGSMYFYSSLLRNLIVIFIMIISIYIPEGI